MPPKKGPIYPARLRQQSAWLHPVKWSQKRAPLEDYVYSTKEQLLPVNCGHNKL